MHTHTHIHIGILVTYTYIHVRTQKHTATQHTGTPGARWRRWPSQRMVLGPSGRDFRVHPSGKPQHAVRWLFVWAYSFGKLQHAVRWLLFLCGTLLWEATARSQVIFFCVVRSSGKPQHAVRWLLFLCGTLFWEATARSQVITFFVWYAPLGSHSTQSGQNNFELEACVVMRVMSAICVSAICVSAICVLLCNKCFGTYTKY